VPTLIIAGDTSGVDSSPRPQQQSVNGIDPTDKNAKNVDSGRVAIVFSSDAMSTFYENWSGSSKVGLHTLNAVYPWRESALVSTLEPMKRKTRFTTISKATLYRFQNATFKCNFVPLQRGGALHVESS
jgi:hypothetical protein